MSGRLLRGWLLVGPMYSMIKRLYSVAVKRVGVAGDYGLPGSAAETPIRASRTASLAADAGWGEDGVGAGRLPWRRTVRRGRA